MTFLPESDHEELQAAINLVGRSGAGDFSVGYHDDTPDWRDARWWAEATYGSDTIRVDENYRGPAEAATALAERLLTGAKCMGCGKLIALSDHGAMFYDAPLVDGTRLTPEMLAAGQCRWRRQGARWEPGCGKRGPRRKRRR